jgi:hypothetical protein
MEAKQDIKLKDKILDFLKRHKVIFVLAVFSSISIIFIIVSAGETQKSPTESEVSPSPSTERQREINSPEYKRVDSNNVYLINRFDTISEIIEPAWYDNKIVYATKFGIYNLWENKQITTTQMAEADFSENASVVYVQNNKLFHANFLTNTNELIDTSSSKAKINNSGSFYNKNGSLVVANLENKETKDSTINVSQNKDFDWITNSQLLYVYNKGIPSVDVYDTNFLKISEYQIGKEELFYGLSPELKYLATTSGDTLYLKNVSSSNFTEYKFTESSKISVNWISSNQVFVTEKVRRGIYDLYDQYFWIIDADSKSKIYLTNSMVIPNKINENITPKMNKEKTAIILTENNGKIWIISLIPSYLSVYKEEGLSFYKIETNTQEY